MTDNINKNIANEATNNQWWIFRGAADHAQNKPFPDPPDWRNFKLRHKLQPIEPYYDLSSVKVDYEQRFGRNISGKLHLQITELNIINAALYLRRPILIEGRPGSGKSSLPYALAYELMLGPVLYWPITSRSTLKEGLYSYDAVARLQDIAAREKGEATESYIGDYIQLGPLGTAFLPFARPRVLLIDEIDKSDLDLPNDLLHIFETGEYRIPELYRLTKKYPEVNVLPFDSSVNENLKTVKVKNGYVSCYEFPVIVMTSNGERQFPPAFLRRCLRLRLQPPSFDQIRGIVKAQLNKESSEIDILIQRFIQKRDQKKEDVTTDQLLNAINIFFNAKGIQLKEEEYLDLFNTLIQPLNK